MLEAGDLAGEAGAVSGGSVMSSRIWRPSALSGYGNLIDGPRD